MSGITKNARELNQCLTKEERKLEKLAKSIPGFETREDAEKERLYRIKKITKAVRQNRHDNREQLPEIKNNQKTWRGRALRLRRRLMQCTIESPCGSAACPQCFRQHRLRKLAELEGLRKNRKAYRVVRCHAGTGCSPGLELQPVPGADIQDDQEGRIRRENRRRFRDGFPR